MTLEALVSGVPVQIFMRELALFGTDQLAACGTVIGVHALEAFTAVRLRVLEEIALTAQQSVTFTAGEVFDVPALAFSLGALFGEDELVTAWTPGFEQLGVISTTVHLAVAGVVEVDEIG